MTTASHCTLCRPDLAPILAEERHWRVVLNHNQNLLGKTMLVLRRHEEAMANLTSQQWADLHGHLRRMQRALEVSFAPDHFNFVFLQNQDRHVHLHVVPRYAAERTWQGLTFRDLDWPDHYGVPGRNPKPISTGEQRAALAQELSAAYLNVSSP